MSTLRDSDAAVAAIQRLQGIGSAPARGNPLLDIPTSPDQPGYHERINLTAAPDDEIEEIDLATGLPLNIVQPPKPSNGNISYGPPIGSTLTPSATRAPEYRILLTPSLRFNETGMVALSLVAPDLSEIVERAEISVDAMLGIQALLKKLVPVVDLAGVLRATNGEDARPSAGGHRRGAEGGAADSSRPDENPSERTAPARRPARRRSRGPADSTG